MTSVYIEVMLARQGEGFLLRAGLIENLPDDAQRFANSAFYGHLALQMLGNAGQDDAKTQNLQISLNDERIISSRGWKLPH